MEHTDSPRHKKALREANRVTRGVGGSAALAARVPGGGTYRGVTNPTICEETARTWTKKLRYKMVGVKPRPTLYPQHYPVRVAGAEEILARAAQPGL